MFRRVILSLFLACVTVVAMATSAEAHATLVSTSPTDGGTVSASPQQVQLTFDDVVNLGPDAVQVTAADGGREDKADAGVTSDGKTVIESLKPNLGNGIHKVGWRITSDDGHIIDGTFSFKVAVPAPAAAPSGPAQNAAPTVPTATVQPRARLGAAQTQAAGSPPQTQAAPAPTQPRAGPAQTPAVAVPTVAPRHRPSARGVILLALLAAVAAGAIAALVIRRSGTDDLSANDVPEAQPTSTIREMEYV